MRYASPAFRASVKENLGTLKALIESFAPPDPTERSHHRLSMLSNETAFNEEESRALFHAALTETAAQLVNRSETSGNALYSLRDVFAAEREENDPLMDPATFTELFLRQQARILQAATFYESCLTRLSNYTEKFNAHARAQEPYKGAGFKKALMRSLTSLYHLNGLLTMHDEERELRHKTPRHLL